jgi:hypothetical protein
MQEPRYLATLIYGRPDMKLRLVVLAGVIGLALAGCSGGQNGGVGAGDSAGAPVTVNGKVTTNIAGHYGKPAQTDAPCDDLANVDVTGKSVKIVDASGETVGLATLADKGAQGLVFDDHDLPSGFQMIEEGTCLWSFSVSDFDSDSDFFTISVDGVNGGVDVSRADLLAGPELTVPAGRP